MSAMRRFVEWAWDGPSRKTDLRILWPACKRESEEMGKGLDGAKAAFYYHVMHDPAWLRRYDDQELRRFVNNLE